MFLSKSKQYNKHEKQQHCSPDQLVSQGRTPSSRLERKLERKQPVSAVHVLRPFWPAAPPAPQLAFPCPVPGRQTPSAHPGHEQLPSPPAGVRRHSSPSIIQPYAELGNETTSPAPRGTPYRLGVRLPQPPHGTGKAPARAPVPAPPRPRRRAAGAG